MNESKIIAAILTIITSATELRDPSAEMGIKNWRKAIKDYERILAELDRDLVKHGREEFRLRSSALRRTFQKPEEIADLLGYFVSLAAKWMTVLPRSWRWRNQGV